MSILSINVLSLFIFVPFPALTLLVLVAIISTMEARSPLTKMAKMNKVAKMRHQATLVQKVMDDCDFAHWCPNGCCDQETDMGNVGSFKNLKLVMGDPKFINNVAIFYQDGDWTCCANPAYICAVDQDTCNS